MKDFIVAAVLVLALTLAAQAKGVLTSPIRGAHFVLAPSSPEASAVPMKNAIRVVDLAHRANFNTVVVEIANSVKLESAPELTRDGAWSKEQFAKFIDYAQTNGLQVVPEMKLLTHQEKFFQKHHPELMYNAVSYDPRKEEVYDIVLPLLDELIELANPSAIHIGHDEVVGWDPAHAKRHLEEGEHMLPAELFLLDIQRIHAHLKEKKVETWIWGDMLLSPDEFPQMTSSYLHGGSLGYGRRLRQQLPRDIVICDWHYSGTQSQFPTLLTMQSEGFRVIGATWDTPQTTQQFSRFAASNGAYGMMATTWFYVPLERFDVVEAILSFSGAAFVQLSNSE